MNRRWGNPSLLDIRTHPWAEFSPCRRYRYALFRPLGPGPVLAVIGHNPSTADETADDPTIRRCLGYARRDGFGALLMLNLCAWRDTNPDGLTLLDDPVGPENDAALLAGARAAGCVLAAWGALARASRAQRVRHRPEEVLRLLRPVAPVYALKVGKDGSPGHPLYLRADLPMSVYREQEAKL